MSAATGARQAAAVLRALLEKVQAGELTAPPGLVRALRGSLAALEAVGSRRGAP